MQLIKYIFRVAYNPRHQNGVSKPRFSAPAQNLILNSSSPSWLSNAEKPEMSRCRDADVFRLRYRFFHPEIHLRSQATVDLLAP